MDEYRYPENFEELVSILRDMKEGEWGDNDDTGHHRYIERVSMFAGNYAMFEDHELVEVTFDVMKVAQFLAEGWDAYEERRN